ncbi:helix-turn-helix domain-containing protein [Morganella morganii]|uniref:Helix-turn-helix transcriptional regulator n=1 Tax=Morganella morganii TaxID=582 RepID=A0AAE4FEV7_MORMO|nr:helix-turn-helix transcriptional regulator [Morganella morganii]MCT1587302.1 helix-turn-helix domain-containing protein [Morganella morganii]MDS0898671.1 helix-turn-helix transcriptional regulator [Morganella morganii]
MKDINFIVGQNIRDLRHRNGLTTKMLAKMLGVSQQQLSRYERGVNKIDVSVVFKIINIFHVSYEFPFPETQNDYTESVKSSFVYMEPLAIG